MIVYILCIVTVTWQGVPVTGPLLIFHSEIQRTVNSNSLTCRHPTEPVAWYLTTNNTRLTTESFGTFLNKITNGRKQAQIIRGTNDRNESIFDGLWTCRLNDATGAGAFHVGVYDDTPTTGKITLKMLPLQVDFSEVYSVCLSCCNICTLFHNHLNMLQKNHRTFKLLYHL